MTIVEQLKTIVETQLSRPVSFVYASIEYANVMADNWQTVDFPVVIVLPLNVTDADGESGILESELDLNMFILDRHQDQTIEYDHLETEKTIVEPMRNIGRNFFHKLMESDLADNERPLPSRTFVPTYSSLDRHTAGVFVSVKVPVIEGVTGCKID